MKVIFFGNCSQTSSFLDLQFSLTITKNIEEFFDLIQSEFFSCIIYESELIEINSIWKLRSSLSHVPYIIALCSSDNINILRKSGAIDDFLVKPISFSMLEHRIYFSHERYCIKSLTIKENNTYYSSSNFLNFYNSILGNIGKISREVNDLVQRLGNLNRGGVIRNNLLKIHWSTIFLSLPYQKITDDFFKDCLEVSKKIANYYNYNFSIHFNDFYLSDLKSQVFFTRLMMLICVLIKGQETKIILSNIDNGKKVVLKNFEKKRNFLYMSELYELLQEFLKNNNISLKYSKEELDITYILE